MKMKRTLVSPWRQASGHIWKERVKTVLARGVAGDSKSIIRELTRAVQTFASLMMAKETSWNPQLFRLANSFFLRPPQMCTPPTCRRRPRRRTQRPRWRGRFRKMRQLLLRSGRVRTRPRPFGSSKISGPFLARVEGWEVTGSTTCFSMSSNSNSSSSPIAPIHPTLHLLHLCITTISSNSNNYSSRNIRSMRDHRMDLEMVLLPRGGSCTLPATTCLTSFRHQLLR